MSVDPAIYAAGAIFAGPSGVGTNGQVLASNGAGGTSWITPTAITDTLTLSGSQDGSTVIAVNSNGNATITTTTDTGGATPGMVFNAIGTWGNGQAVFSFRENGAEYLKIDGLGAVTVGTGGQGGFTAPSTNPAVGGQGYIGSGMRRVTTTAGMQFYYGESLGIATPGFLTAPIGGTHNPAGIAHATYLDASKTIAAFLVMGDGGVRLPMLPTTDPLAAGELWNDAGTVKVSAG